jgi:hypothetical protein
MLIRGTATVAKCDNCHVANAVVSVETPAGELGLCGHDYDTLARANIVFAGYPSNDFREMTSAA